MKKLLPFILPAIALFAVVFFANRWYKDRTEEKMTVPEVTAGTEIEELSTAELEALEKLKQGEGNYKKLELESDHGLGEIRYEIKDDKVLLSINANLPTDNQQVYQLYLKDKQNPDYVFVKNFQWHKGGIMVSTAVNKANLPILIQVREGEKIVLTGEIKE